MAKGKYWMHPKFKSKFLGVYSKSKSGERIFELVVGSRRISFESWQMAKQVGWYRV